MKLFRKLICTVILLMCISMVILPVFASTYSEYDGLQVTIVMDKEEYDEGEPITATITLTNTNSWTVNVVNLEQLIPDGYELAENSTAALTEFEIASGETVVLEVTMVGQPTQTEEGEETGDFFDKLLYGESFGVPNLLIAVLAVIAFVIYMLLT